MIYNNALGPIITAIDYTILLEYVAQTHDIADMQIDTWHSDHMILTKSKV